MVESFKPLVGEHVHTLILGTMPGTASLAKQQYYAHQRNAFWPIMMAIVDQTPVDKTTLPSIKGYQYLCQKLTKAGFAVWDVLQYCERQGSLDSNIVRQSEVANDIHTISKQHPELQTIAFNGQTAEKLFNRHISKVSTSKSNPSKTGYQLPHLPLHTVLDTVQVSCTTLPSSSPAMASLTLEEKFTRWHQLLIDTPGRLGENISTN